METDTKNVESKTGMILPLTIVIVAILLIVGIVYYVNRTSGANSSDLSSQDNSTDLNSVLVGSAMSPNEVARQLAQYDYPVKDSYENFSELIEDIKSKNNDIARVRGEIDVGGRRGYEVSVSDRAGAWLVSGNTLYTFYFNHTGPLSSAEKEALSQMNVSSLNQ